MGSEKKYSHVLDKFQHIVPLSDVDRIRFIDQPRWIGYGKAHRALTIMEGLLSKTKQPRIPQHQPHPNDRRTHRHRSCRQAAQPIGCCRLRAGGYRS